MRPGLAVLAVAVAAPACFGQQKTGAAGSNRMEMKIERQEGDRWKIVDPALVFDQNDRVRFRFRTNFDGYLYVMNEGTSGEYTLLFPREDTGRQNRIESGKEYMVPSTEQGSFRIAGPAGHDIVYWMVSPVELKSGSDGRPAYRPLPPPPVKTSPARKSLRPRCDDAILRARGECIDSAAGLRSLNENSELPENLSSVPKMNSRDLIFIREQQSSVISSPVPLKGPVIYEFRLAHK